MRVLVEIIVVAVAVGVPIVVLYRVPRLWRRLREDRRLRNASWEVEPRTLPNGDRQVWLTKYGEEPFLFQTVPATHGRVDDSDWSEALYRGEEQALEFDRLALPARGR